MVVCASVAEHQLVEYGQGYGKMQKLKLIYVYVCACAVSGVAALFLSTQSAAVPASAVEAALVAAASPNEVLTAGRKSPNLLLFTNY